MYKYLIIVGAIVVLFGQNQNRLFWDGRDWERVGQLVDYNPELSYRVKAAYVNGVLDGRLFYYFKIWAEQSEFADSIFAETPDYLSTKELVKSLNSFYEEPLNLYVPLPSAIIIANMYGEQVPVMLIDDYIQQSKFWINQLMLDMEKDGYDKLLEGKARKHQDKLLKKN